MGIVRSQKSFPVSEWPKLDREAWRRAQEKGDEFSGSGAAAEWAHGSRRNAERAYGHLLGYLRRSNRLRPVRRTGKRLVPKDLCAMGRELHAKLAPYTVRGIFASLGMAFSAMDPGADRSVLNEIVARLSRTARSVRDISNNLLSPKQLAAIGRTMMDEADEQTRMSGRRASLYRDGLVTLFETFCPLRPGAVGEMQIGEHLIIEGDKVRVRLPPAQGKKRRLEDVPLTDELARRFLRYIHVYRPMFPAPASKHAKALWISGHGNAMDGDDISKCIKARMRVRAGKRFTAHMFRHACATYIMDVAPEQAGIIVGVLGHAGFRTAKLHYIKGQQHMAVKKYQQTVRGIMRRGRRRRNKS